MYSITHTSKICLLISSVILIYVSILAYIDSLSHQELYLVPKEQKSVEYSFENYVRMVKPYDKGIQKVRTKSVPSKPEAILQVFIHSSPNHFMHRRLIRESWGSVSCYRNLSMNVIFVIGLSGLSVINVKVQEEASRHSDILWADFIDSYWNLTLKHIFAHRWIIENCTKAKFVLKVDDDIFVDIFQVIGLIIEEYSKNPRNLLACSISAPVLARRSGKWELSLEEYPFRTLPAFCAGAAYLASIDVIRSWSVVLGEVPRMRIDDVFVTGILRDAIRVSPLRLNVHYTDDESKLLVWASSGTGANVCPWIFGLLTTSWMQKKVNSLWNRTKSVHGFLLR